MLNKNKTGLALGVFMAAVHFLWSVAVMAGFGQKLLDLVFKLHYLSNPLEIRMLTAWRFAGLLVMTFIVGYIMGWVFACVWNWADKKTA